MIKKGGNGKSTVDKNGVACFQFTASFFHVQRKEEKPKSPNYTFPLFNWFSQWGGFCISPSGNERKKQNKTTDFRNLFPRLTLRSNDRTMKHSFVNSQKVIGIVIKVDFEQFILSHNENRKKQKHVIKGIKHGTVFCL